MLLLLLFLWLSLRVRCDVLRELVVESVLPVERHRPVKLLVPIRCLLLLLLLLLLFFPYFFLSSDFLKEKRSELSST